MLRNFDFDAIVVGGGHAGVEASFALAHLGKKVLLTTLHKKMIANTPCNPHIGGSAKGIVVREIDASKIPSTAACDVNGDGRVNAVDCVLVKQFLAHLINKFPA